MDKLKKAAIRAEIHKATANLSATNVTKAYDIAYDVLEEIDENYP